MAMAVTVPERSAGGALNSPPVRGPPVRAGWSTGHATKSWHMRARCCAVPRCTGTGTRTASQAEAHEKHIWLWTTFEPLARPRLDLRTPLPRATSHGPQSSAFLPAASLLAHAGSFWPGTILKRASPPSTLSSSPEMPCSSPLISPSSPWSSFVKRKRLCGLKTTAEGSTEGSNRVLNSVSTFKFSHIHFILAPRSLSCEVNFLERPVSMSVSAPESSPSFK
mmetsp:Transcript_29778/g.88487  ORF Transcript_29778/g.88487 Transcript_29778/m.88487 type:complete len:222 (-) Transcript_29778:700-1365(-)